MNYVCEENKCCGCSACVSVCPKNCINIEDHVSVLNAVKDMNKCINCGLCSKVCQVSNSSSELIKLNKTVQCLEGVTLNSKIDAITSSGGFATTLGVEFAKGGGYVVGVRGDTDKFEYSITNKPDEVLRFAGSKYVKVIPNIYTYILELLKQNQKVLFIGTPCNVAGLKMFLRKDYDNLYTVDLICHGTPSDKILMKYLNEEGINSEKNLKFRKKHTMYLTRDKKAIYKTRILDPYTIGFLKGLYYTENCYECRYAQGDRVSDITIGDSWGSKNQNEKYKYLSLILCQTNKANYLLNLIKDEFITMKCDYENAVANNHQLSHPSKKSEYTDYFFKNFDNNFKYLIKKAYPKTYYRQKIKRIFVLFGLK